MLKKIAVLSRYDRQGASSRLRMMQFEEVFSKNGIQLEYFPLFDHVYLKNLYQGKGKSKLHILKCYFYRLYVLLFKLSSADVVWLEKELFPGFPSIFEKCLSYYKPYVVDYDDAVFHNYDLSSSFWMGTLLKNKIDKVMKWSRSVVVGSPYLQDRAWKAVGEHKNKVHFIPTVIDEKKYGISSENSSKDQQGNLNISSDNFSKTPESLPKVVIGWIGSPSTEFYLKELESVFQNIQKKYPQVEFQWMGVSDNFALNGVSFVRVPWSEESEVSWIQKVDIGIMPLRSTPWELGKCGYKLIQFMACGKPVVASKVGANIQIVDEEVGFLCQKQEQWIQAFQALIPDFELRKKTGASARKKVSQYYSIAAIEKKLLHIFLLLDKRAKGS